MPIHLGEAKLQKSYHTLVHYYDLSVINNEILELNNHYNIVSKLIHKHQNQYKEIENYDKIFKQTYKSVRDKFTSLFPRNRNKRGLINGLGTAVKFVTGNMDADDATRINRIVKNLENNQRTLQHQINNQYSLNENIVKQFNYTVQNIQYNGQQLKGEIMKLNNVVQKEDGKINTLILKDVLNQLILMYNIILNILTEIENSLAFCTIGAMHPSIIRVTDLLLELQKLVPFYGNQLPVEVNIENILTYQSLIKVHCQHDGDKIIYFLTIPIEYNTQFELYYLESLPTLIKDEYFTIIPNFKYVLKNKDFIKPLLDTCSMNNIYHCPSKIATSGNTTCEGNIIQGNSTTGCLYTKLHLNISEIQPLPHLSQYLGWFKENTVLEGQCPHEKQILKPKGIFLLKFTSDCKIVFNGEELRKREPTKNTPTIIDFKIPQDKHPVPLANITIGLKSLHLNKIDQHHSEEISFDGENHGLDIYIPSIWTLLIYLGIIMMIIFAVVRKAKKTQGSTNRTEEVPMNPLQLPSEASF